MEFLANLGLGFTTAFSGTNLLYCFIGVLMGTLVGVLPGIGPAATMAMLLPITFNLDPTASLIMLAGIYYGAQYGGSTTAILINLPGESSSSVTAIDGYRMAQMGRAGPALATAAIGSFFAGTVATLVIAAAAMPLTRVALLFGPPEYFALVMLGLIASVVLARGSVVKALGMIVVGLLAGIIGQDIYTGVARFNFGVPELSNGVNLVAAAAGVFGVAEILRNLEDEKTRTVVIAKVTSLMPSREDFRRMVAPILRGTGLGLVLGILPGGGSLLAAFASYATEKKASKDPASFGNGAIEGVAGPESANNAGAQASFIPMLTLGVPNNSVMALMIGAMIIQGIIPGPTVITRTPDLFWGLIASMWIGNVMLLVLNLPLIGLWVKLLDVPYRVLFPAIIAFASIGIFSMNNNIFDVYALALFGLGGYFLVKFGCEPAPFLLGLILSPLLEQHLRSSLIISRGSPWIFFERPISATLIAITIVVLAIVLLPNMRRQRETIFAEDD